jgi:phosphatidylglycerol:prolipoprotein diacylglycerol transferase
MRPRLFHIGPFTIYGYGLMLALGFIIGSYVLTEEFKRRKLDPNIASTITLLALFAGVAGCKILYLIENWNYFLLDPAGMAFNPGGLTYFGGFLLAMACIAVYLRKKKLSFLLAADAVAPALMLGYGIARIGCHLAGDGDYGFPTTLPWGTDYDNGTFPPREAFRDFPEITKNYPGGIVPDHTLCHPTPVYEFLICTALFFLLWKMRKTTSPNGKLFMLYLIFAGIERFVVEFLRLNPRILAGLSEAQLISLLLIGAGVIGWRKLSMKQPA